MNRYVPLALCLVAVAAPSLSYSVLWGTAGFSQPGSWAEINRADADTVSVVGFVLPRPAGDSAAPAANVVVQVTLDHAQPSLHDYSERKMQQVIAGPGSPKLVSDVITSADSSRVVTWTSSLRGSDFDLADRFAVLDSVQVDIRAIIPAIYRSDSLWQRRFAAEIDTLAHSLCVGPRHLFPATTIPCASIDHILPFSPAENADGARFIWFLNRLAGIPYSYVPAALLPGSPEFRAVSADSARAGDVAWWPSLVGLYTGSTKSISIVGGIHPLADYVTRLGEAKFYRRQVKQ